MSLTMKVALYGIQTFQKVLETAQGGFTLDLTGLTLGTVIPSGTLFGFNEATRLARPIKTATLQANVTNTATDYPVLKGHLYKVGDFFSAVKGGKSYAITAINTADPAFDVITVGTTLGVALTAGQGFFQSASAGASAASPIVEPKGLLYDPLEVAANSSLSVVIRGTVYARRIPYVSAEVRAMIPTVLFSESF